MSSSKNGKWVKRVRIGVSSLYLLFYTVCSLVNAPWIDKGGLSNPLMKIFFAAALAALGFDTLKFLINAIKKG